MNKKIITILMCLSMVLVAHYANAGTETKKTYYDNRAIKKVTPYRDGQKHGTVKMYYESGDLAQKIYYKEGVKLEVTSYYKDGTLASKRLFKDGQAEGMVKYYYRDGKLKYHLRIV